MKKVAILLALFCMLTVTASAAYIPEDVISENRDGRQLIVKTYMLPPDADPSGLVEEPFEVEGYSYHHLETVKEEQTFEDSKIQTEVVTLETDVDDLAAILEQLDASMEYNKDGYSGVLTLDHTTIQTEAAGYTTKYYTITDTKQFTGLDRNDPSYVPTTTVKNGSTLKLSDISWTVTGTGLADDTLVPTSYTATATYDKPANLKVTVTKTGNKQLLAGDSMRYDLTVANNSNVPLENFYLHDRFPTDCATAKTITTGTYNTRLNYQITYKTNYNDYRVLATNLLSTNNYAFDLSAISLMQDEVVTDVRLEFGKVPAGFASVVKPTVTIQTSANLANGYQVVNRADAGGQYMSQWETGRAAWITLIVKLNQPNLPKTGY